MDEIGVVGAGGEGRAVTAHLSSIGRAVRLCTRNPAQVGGIRRSGSIRASGALTGSFPVAEVTGEPARVAAGCRVLVVAAITTAYRDIAEAFAPHLTDRHVVVLFSGKLCGSAEFAAALAGAGRTGVDVVETDALFAARPDGDDGVVVHGAKGWNLFSGAAQESVRRCGPLVQELFPWVEPARNLVERGLTDFGAVAHAPIALANLGSIERGEGLLFYVDGMSDRTVVLLEQVEREFRAVARAYGADLLPMTQVLDRCYGCTTSDLLAAMRSVEAYRTITAPDSLDHRFLREDIASTLVPLEALAERAGLGTPVVSSLINIMGLLSGERFRETGRTLDRLGWAGLDHGGIIGRLTGRTGAAARS